MYEKSPPADWFCRQIPPRMFPVCPAIRKIAVPKSVRNPIVQAQVGHSHSLRGNAMYCSSRVACIVGLGRREDIGMEDDTHVKHGVVTSSMDYSIPDTAALSRTYVRTP